MGLNPLALGTKNHAVSASPRPTLIPFWVPRSLSPRHKMPMVFCWPKMARFGWCFWGLGQQEGNKYLRGWVELWLGMGREKWKNNLWWFQSVDIDNFAFLMRNPLTVAPEDGWKITEYLGDSWWHRFRCYVPFQEGRSWQHTAPITPVNDNIQLQKPTKKQLFDWILIIHGFTYLLF